MNNPQSEQRNTLRADFRNLMAKTIVKRNLSDDELAEIIDSNPRLYPKYLERDSDNFGWNVVLVPRAGEYTKPTSEKKADSSSYNFWDEPTKPNDGKPGLFG